MPELKQLDCWVEATSSRVPLREYEPIYQNGFVETFVALPEEDDDFCIRLISKGWIHEGICMWVFIDGVYQCNRMQLGLKEPVPGKKRASDHVDLVVRNKEDQLEPGRGEFISTNWTFEGLNVAVADKVPHKRVQELREVGTIEVIVLRCHGRAPEPPKLSIRSRPITIPDPKTGRCTVIRSAGNGIEKTVLEPSEALSKRIEKLKRNRVTFKEDDESPTNKRSTSNKKDKAPEKSAIASKRNNTPAEGPSSPQGIFGGLLDGNDSEEDEDVSRGRTCHKAECPFSLDGATSDAEKKIREKHSGRWSSYFPDGLPTFPASRHQEEPKLRRKSYVVGSTLAAQPTDGGDGGYYSQYKAARAQAAARRAASASAAEQAMRDLERERMKADKRKEKDVKKHLPEGWSSDVAEASDEDTSDTDSTITAREWQTYTPGQRPKSSSRKGKETDKPNRSEHHRERPRSEHRSGSRRQHEGYGLTKEEVRDIKEGRAITLQYDPQLKTYRERSYSQGHDRDLASPERDHRRRASSRHHSRSTTKPSSSRYPPIDEEASSSEESRYAGSKLTEATMSDIVADLPTTGRHYHLMRRSDGSNYIKPIEEHERRQYRDGKDKRRRGTSPTSKRDAEARAAYPQGNNHFLNQVQPIWPPSQPAFFPYPVAVPGWPFAVSMPPVNTGENPSPKSPEKTGEPADNDWDDNPGEKKTHKKSSASKGQTGQQTTQDTTTKSDDGWNVYPTGNSNDNTTAANQDNDNSGWYDNGNDNAAQQDNDKASSTHSDANWAQSSNNNNDSWGNEPAATDPAPASNEPVYEEPIRRSATRADYYVKQPKRWDLSGRPRSTPSPEPEPKPAPPPPPKVPYQRIKHSENAKIGGMNAYLHVQELGKPIYDDTFEKPYAVFTFKYRSKGALENILGKSIEETPAEFEERMKKAKPEAVLAELMKLKRQGVTVRKETGKKADEKSNDPWGSSSHDSRVEKKNEGKGINTNSPAKAGRSPPKSAPAQTEDVDKSAEGFW